MQKFVDGLKGKIEAWQRTTAQGHQEDCAVHESSAYIPSVEALASAGVINGLGIGRGPLGGRGGGGAKGSSVDHCAHRIRQHLLARH